MTRRSSDSVAPASQPPEYSSSRHVDNRERGLRHERRVLVQFNFRQDQSDVTTLNSSMAYVTPPALGSNGFSQ